MKSPDLDLERNVLLLFLGMLIIGVIIAFVGNYYSTQTEHKDKPEWINLTANESHIFFTYDAESIPGFKAMYLQATWHDPYTAETRELYSMTSELDRNNISFPKFVTLGSPSMTVGATVETLAGPEIIEHRRYIWRVTQEPLTFGLDSPTIDYIR